MLERKLYREKLGIPIKTCMACGTSLETSHSRGFGLCGDHWVKITTPPHHIRRNFGRGTEYQLFHHSDELDDILFRLENHREPSADPELAVPDAFPPGELPYLINAYYIAGIYLNFLHLLIPMETYDFITFSDSCYTSMEFIFPEMGYLAEDRDYAKTFLSDELHYLMQEELRLPMVAGKRVLLLDLYRSYDTRTCIDRLRLSGAREVTTVYLTSYS